MKKVSVIMPAYNAEKYIRDSINSVLNQSYKNIELIIVDDKSTDNTASIAQHYASMYPNIKVIINRENSLAGYSRNIGVQHSSGEYIAFIDADDIYREDYLEKLVRAIEESGTNISMCKYRNFIGSGQPIKDESSGNVTIVDINNCPGFLLNNHAYCWNKLYKRELFDKLMFPTGIIFEDIPFTYPMLILGEKIAVLDSELYYYRRNTQGITIRNKRIPQRGILDLYYASAELDKNYQLVRQNNKLDRFMKEKKHSVIYISALDSSCWLQMPYKDYKRIVNLFAFLANRKYGLTIEENGYMQYLKKNRLLYRLRLMFLKLSIDNDFFTNQTDEEILMEIEKMIDNYNQRISRKKEKVKKKL